MNHELIFRVANLAVLPGWALLVFAPGWRWTQVVAGTVLPVTMSALYALLFVTHITGSNGDFGSLASVQLLFQTPVVALAGWVHYLAFDLFIGAWIARDARRQSLSQLAVAPFLLLTFILGPLGLASYCCLRYARTRKWKLSDGDAT